MIIVVVDVRKRNSIILYIGKMVNFKNNILLIGFGAVGQAVLPLLLKHVVSNPEQITVYTADNSGKKIADKYGVKHNAVPLTKENYREILSNHLRAGDFLLNLSVDVSSTALIECSQELGALYLDTCIEPWQGYYTDSELTTSERSNYALREQALAKRNDQKKTTAVIAHGANPGLVSHFIKQALLNIADKYKVKYTTPKNSQEWAQLANTLQIKTIQIAEQDTQVTKIIKKNHEFVNTWSIDGFISEGIQPAELGWGSHERELPQNGRTHTTGCGAAIYLNQPGLMTKVRAWAPQAGSYNGFLVTHNEAISTSDFYTIRNGDEVTYRPTVYYAYNPSQDTILSVHEHTGRNFKEPNSKRLLMDEIESGTDELGVLLLGPLHKAYWYGSRLSIEEARKLVPHNNATSLQIAAGVLSGVIWTIENPNQGLVEAEDLDYKRVLEIASPYLGKMVGEYSDWTPLNDRINLFEEDTDQEDPYQFKNFLAN